MHILVLVPRIGMHICLGLQVQAHPRMLVIVEGNSIGQNYKLWT